MCQGRVEGGLAQLNPLDAKTFSLLHPESRVDFFSALVAPWVSVISTICCCTQSGEEDFPVDAVSSLDWKGGGFG